MFLLGPMASNERKSAFLHPNAFLALGLSFVGHGSGRQDPLIDLPPGFH